MDRAVAEQAVRLFLRELHQRLTEATSVAAAATACAEAGNLDKGIEVALDVEQLGYEASRLLDAASLINRLAKSPTS